MRVRLLGICTLLLACTLPRAAAAESDFDYGSVPPALDAIVLSQNQRARGSRALRLLEEAEHAAQTTWDHVPPLRAQLVLLGPHGLRLVAERLCAGKTTPWFRNQLCSVVAEADHAAADQLLTIAAQEPFPAMRMIAAEGLGRGRTPHAVTVLEGLTRDTAPGVRIAAVRSLFAIDSPQARAARAKAPREIEPRLWARRLAWHRRAADTHPAVVRLAAHALATGPDAEVRTEAAAYLADPMCGKQTATPLLERIIEEFGQEPVFLVAPIFVDVYDTPYSSHFPTPYSSHFPAAYGEAGAPPLSVSEAKRRFEQFKRRVRVTPDATARDDVNRFLGSAFRWRYGIPTRGYDPIVERRIAVDAALTLLDRQGLTPGLRARMIQRALHWIAHPVVFMDPFREDAVPEYELMRRLPDLGSEVLAPTIAALESGAFSNPQDGFRILRELGPDVALPWIRDYIQRQLAEGLPHPYRLVAACSALADLGAVGDEALARRLFFDLPESLKGLRGSIRTDVGTALRKDPGAWVVPLVAEGLDSSDDEIEAEAQRVLATRTEPEARQARVEAFFRRPKHRGHDRLRALAWRGDEQARATLERALADKRRLVVNLALRQFNPRNRALHDKARFLPMVQSVASRMKTAYEVQDYVYALLVLDPEEAVAYVRSAWDTMPNDNARENALRILQEVQGKHARQAAIDLALEKAVADAPLDILTSAAAVLGGQWTHRTVDVEAFWRRLLQPDHPQRRMAVRLVATKGAPDLTDLLLPMVDELRKTAAALNEDEDATRQLIDALGHQPRKKVEGLLVEAALDPLMPGSARETALGHLKGNISEATRLRLMIWAGYTLPTEGTVDPSAGLGQDDHGDMQWYVGQVIGEGAKGDIAEALLRTLDKELRTWAKKQPTFRKAGRKRTLDSNVENRIRASTRAIAETRHKPSIAALIDRLFDEQLVRVVQIRAESFASAFDWAGPGAAGRRAAHPSILNYGAVVPAEVALEPAGAIVGQLKVLKDEQLAPLMAAALQRALERGALAPVPDIYFALLCGQFLHRGTGTCLKTASVLLEYAMRTSPRDSAVEHRALSWMIEAREEHEQFEEALADEERRVRIVSRRALEVVSTNLLHVRRTHGDALRGTFLARAGKPAEARAAFSRALLRAPHDHWTLNSVAWYLFMADLDLGLAEDLARRAVRLDRRTPGPPDADLADTLACVLLARGKAPEGLEILEARMRTMGERSTGAYHLHWAWLLAAVGELARAEAALAEALRIDPRMADRLAGDKYLKPLRSRFKAAIRAAKEEW